MVVVELAGAVTVVVVLGARVVLVTGATDVVVDVVGECCVVVVLREGAPLRGEFEDVRAIMEANRATTTTLNTMSDRRARARRSSFVLTSLPHST